MKYIPKIKDELKAFISDDSVYLGDIDTSFITDMSGLFYKVKRSSFKCIECWNTKNVENMGNMFYDCKNFNEPLNNWDVSNVKNMESMFFCCHKFNQPLNKWNVSKVEDMERMFWYCKSFNQHLDKWDVSKVKN